MKSLAFLLPVVAFIAACGRTPETPSTAQEASFPTDLPVVAAEPVDTVSYEAGYRAGHPIGAAAATRGAAVPKQSEVAELAAGMAGDDPAHNSKWRRGWVEGDLDPYRARAHNAK